jgi:hypothetical protein
MTSWLKAAKKEDLEKFLLESVDADKLLSKFSDAKKAGKEEKKAGNEEKKAGKEEKAKKDDKKADKEEKGKKVRQYRLVPRLRP